MHAVVAEYLEASVSPEGEATSALARHWRAAGRPDRAVDYLVSAAEQAMRGWAKAHAFTLYGEALQCVTPEDEELTRTLRQRQAVAWQALMHLPDAMNLGRTPQPEG
jgi:hypothetical protein